MEKDLSCNLIKDMLPNLIEGKVNKETESLIRSHMDICVECTAEYNNMKTLINLDGIKVKKIDFLKLIYIKIKNALLICAFLTLVMLIISLYFTEVNTLSSLMFYIFLLIIVIAYTVLPLFILVLTAFLYKKTNKKWLIIICLISGGIYISSIITQINNIIKYGF